jgi:antitoxin component YwqK of YwqJK toxin-antitoxin module
MAAIETYTTHHDDGSVKLVASIADGQLHGPLESYLPDGTSLLRMKFEQGQTEGTATFHSASGQLLAEIEFARGVQHGESRLYQDGRLSAVQQWQGGDLLRVTMLDSEGRPARELQFEAGKLCGRQTEFHPGGAIAKTAEYRDGLPDGETIEYDERGKPKKRTCFRAGEPVRCPGGWFRVVKE